MAVTMPMVIKKKICKVAWVLTDVKEQRVRVVIVSEKGKRRLSVTEQRCKTKTPL